MAAVGPIDKFPSVDEAMSMPSVTEQLNDARIADLESALRRYGRHESGCGVYIKLNRAPENCTCGLAEALARGIE